MSFTSNPATNEIAAIKPDIAIIFKFEADWGLEPNTVSILASAFVELTPRRGFIVSTSSSYFWIFPSTLLNHPLRPRMGSTTIVICPLFLKKLF